MESRIVHSSLLSDFLDVDFSTRQLSAQFKTLVDSILLKNDLSTKNDWLIVFRVVYNNGRQLLISKNRFGTLYSDRIKEIHIVIPIPSIQGVPWGVKDNQYIYGPDHYQTLLKNFWVEEVHVLQFNTRADYIYDCLRRAIERAFFEGFTVGGVKIVAKSI